MTDSPIMGPPTHEVRLVRKFVPVLVTDDEGDDMLNAAAVGHAELINMSVQVKRLSDGKVQLFTAEECKEWWA